MNTKILRYSLIAAATILAPVAKAVAADSTIVADFETQTNMNNIQGFWFYVTDQGSGGNSKVTSGDTTANPPIFGPTSFGENATAGGMYSGRMAYTLGTVKPACGAGCTYPNEVTFGTNVEPILATTQLDITGATSISFWAKATPAVTISVIFLTTDITDYSWARAAVPVTSTWKRYTANFSGTSGIVFKSTYGQGKDKPLNLKLLQGLNFAIQKDASNPNATSGELLIDDLTINGWKSPLAGIRDVSRSNLSQALRASADGKSLRFSVPAAYRNLAGTVAAIDLSGKTVAKAAFAKGQENVSLSLSGHQAATVFLRVFTGSDAL
ncbi:MAG: hypothetical protein JWP91_4148 [Fibrobacteres bacterium]|nr:hypothetical protein [Fibrobacterota bacterium]